ncbi:MAG TPA: hypothetical protein VGS19_23015 [Streptosporangiaceae bacterium]|nr:hypothetical protein [Streptosporangiaceae bacterium]
MPAPSDDGHGDARRHPPDRAGGHSAGHGRPAAHGVPPSQPLTAPLTGARIYRGWMFVGEPVTPAMAAALRPLEVVSLSGVPIATAHEDELPMSTSVVFAIYGTALDVSELEGLPQGSVLFLDGARAYQVADDPGEAYPAAIRVTLRQH